MWKLNHNTLDLTHFLHISTGLKFITFFKFILDLVLDRPVGTQTAKYILPTSVLIFEALDILELRGCSVDMI